MNEDDQLHIIEKDNGRGVKIFELDRIFTEMFL